MSLTKEQFEILVAKVIQKISSTEGANSFIESNPGCFDNTRNKGLYYQATPELLVDLDMLEQNGAMIPSDEYDSFICQLILDTEDLVNSVKFVNYLEKISRL